MILFHSFYVVVLNDSFEHFELGLTKIRFAQWILYLGSQIANILLDTSFDKNRAYFFCRLTFSSPQHHSLQ